MDRVFHLTRQSSGWLTGLVVALYLVGTPPPALADQNGLAIPSLPDAPSKVPALRRLPDGSLVPVLDDQPSPPAPVTSKPVTSQPKPVPVQTPVRPTPTPGPTSPPPKPAASARFASCPPRSVTCVQVTQTGKGGWLPVTFGQPFRPGDVPAGTRLAVDDGSNHLLPLQLDGLSTFPDGSLRFAILSTEVPNVPANEVRRLSIVKTDARAQPAAPAATSPVDLVVEVKTFQNHVVKVKFGNRKGVSPGVPFRQGEVVTLKVGEGAAAERFSLTIDPTMADLGSLKPYMTIAKAFVALINRESRHYRSSWSDANDNYECAFVSATNPSQPVPVAVEYQGKATISAETYAAAQAPRVWTAKLTTTGPSTPWLDGPVVNERDFKVPLISDGEMHPLLSVRVHLRRYVQSGAVRADVVLNNDWAYQPGPRTLSYDVVIRRDGAIASSQAEITHYHHARWHQLFWFEGQAEPKLVHWVPYLLESRSIPHYNPSLIVPDAVIARDFDAFAKAKGTEPFSTGTVTPYMPTTGGRADIGVLPRWAVLYLLSMDPRQRQVLFGNADAGAGIPLHYRDAKTDLPVSLDDHPTTVMNVGRPSSQDAFPPVAINDSPWTPQIAHHPSLSYVPYLLTGDLFYLEEVRFWANWVLASVDPGYRGGGTGLVVNNEVRGLAWSIRTLGEAATILPDTDPMKRYFNEKLGNTLRWLNEHYTRNPNPAQSPIIGVIPKPDQPEIMSPWQQDYLFMALGQLDAMKIPGAEDLARWLARFSVGRWGSDDKGFCYQKAPGYYLKIRDTSGRLAVSLKEVFQLNWPEITTCPTALTDGQPADPGGYVALSYGMLGYAETLGIPGAAAARTRIRQEAPGLFQRFPENPTFDIVPYGSGEAGDHETKKEEPSDRPPNQDGRSAR